jgi:hypothetical protein
MISCYAEHPLGPSGHSPTLRVREKSLMFLPCAERAGEYPKGEGVFKRMRCLNFSEITP